jgi:pimeloyl-ACP methyl ester carboxylesterase
MRCLRLLVSSLVLACASVCVARGLVYRVASPLEGFVEVNAVRLQYLDWGGTGPALILIHGLGDNAHVYDDLAPAFTDRFHVIAYTRRGGGGSELKGPFDTDTLTEDLARLMDALGIEKASLVGWSAGGNEVTAMAEEYPQRVERIIYFDGIYDTADPRAKTVIGALPVGFFDPPSNALDSLAAFRAYLKAMLYPELDDMTRIEANLRQKVVIQADGSVKYRVPPEVPAALYSALWTNKPRDYSRVHCPALVLYADTLYDLHVPDAERRRQLEAYEHDYWGPFQAKSLDRLRRELAGVQIVRVRGTHTNFFLMDRQHVVNVMRRFLSAPAK